MHALRSPHQLERDRQPLRSRLPRAVMGRWGERSSASASEVKAEVARLVVIDGL